MPEYQRFVTYMFRYENGKKMENCGFAKVEVRQQECRIQIQLKGITAEKTDVYLLNDNIDFPKGLFLGSMSVHDHMAGNVFGCHAEHVNDTQYTIRQIRGIYIVTGEDTFVASQWDDQETRWKNFRPWEAKTENSATSEGNISGAENNVGHPENKSEAEKATILTGGKQKAESVSILTEGKSNTENAIQCSKNINEELEASRTKNERKDTIEEDRISVDKKELQATQQTVVVSEKNFSVTMGMEKMLSAWETEWERFTATHTLFCPFDEDEGVYGVKLQLQDFKVLPKQYHYLANNSFLLHGYYNYQMLLFGYMQGEAKQWFLGIPGVFSNQEQLLAGIFGFPEFRTKQVTRQKTGEFGYWYRYLDMRK